MTVNTTGSLEHCFALRQRFLAIECFSKGWLYCPQLNQFSRIYLSKELQSIAKTHCFVRSLRNVSATLFALVYVFIMFKRCSIVNLTMTTNAKNANVLRWKMWDVIRQEKHCNSDFNPKTKKIRRF
uniref:Uncharacterized protein n=1 Tax=Sipha flava TaxID=143950 RepID=A0A2S2PZJ0_9HEMI